MTKKRNKDIDKDNNQAISEEQAASSNGNGVEVDNLSAANETNIEEELAALNDKYLRLYSEFDNYRKRSIKERAEILQTAAESVITQILPVLDDFERALSALTTNEETEANNKGMALIYTKLKRILEQKGLEEMNLTDEPFCTDFHEAVALLQVEEESKKGKVLDVVEKGYLLNGKVIRFAKVTVGN